MFQREPRKLRTQELSLAPLFKLILVKHYNCLKLKHQNEIEFKFFYTFYINFPQVSLQPDREIVTYKKKNVYQEKKKKKKRQFLGKEKENTNEKISR